jgi:small subunit ribosomal protein S13
MIVLLNVPLKDSQRVVITLTQIFGINKPTSKDICAQLGFSETLKVSDLTQNHQERLSQALRQLYVVENERLSLIRKQTQRLVSISSWRGIRLSQGLPCRGQRTHGNARTAKRLNAHRVKRK